MANNYPKVIQSIHFPVSAKSFVEPIVSCLNNAGISTELWFEARAEHDQTIREIKAPSRLVELDVTLNPIRFLRRLTKLRRTIRSLTPHVFHSHQMRASFLPLLSAKLEGVPVRIYHNHGLPYLGYKGLMRMLLRSIERVNISLSTHVIFVSHSNMREAVSDGLLGPNKGRVFANGSAVGIDFASYAPSYFTKDARARAKSDFHISDANFVLGYVGRPVARKGFHRLLKAWNDSALSSKGGILLIAGCTDNDCKRVLGNSVSGVIGIGYASDLRPFYAACDAVALPSDHEGFPYALLEAAAAGRALLGTDIPGIRCAIEPNTTGVLVKKGNSEQLTAAIIKLFRDKNVRETLGENARTRAMTYFNRDLVLRDLLSFYENELRVDRSVLNRK